MIQDPWLRRQHQLARTAGLIGLAFVLAYLGLGGLLIRLASNRGAYLDATLRPEWYFGFFGEVSYLFAVIFSPGLLAAAGVVGLSVCMTLRPTLRGQIRGVQVVVGTVGIVAQLAVIAAEF